MDKAIFTLNNTDIHHKNCEFVFKAFDLLLSDPTSLVHEFLNYKCHFSKEDFKRLHWRIVIKKQKMVRMDMLNVVVFYSVIHFVCHILVNKNEEAILVNGMEMNKDAFTESKEQVLKFGKISSVVLTNRFIKSKAFTNAIRDLG